MTTRRAPFRAQKSLVRSGLESKSRILTGAGKRAVDEPMILVAIGKPSAASGETRRGVIAELASNG